jgi:hypothetical protein
MTLKIMSKDELESIARTLAKHDADGLVAIIAVLKMMRAQPTFDDKQFKEDIAHLPFLIIRMQQNCTRRF